MIEYNLKHLQYIVAAAGHGSFRKAATALGVRESAISRRIRDLEDQIGASLFLRRPDGVSPTLAGQRFINKIEQALAHLREGADDIAEFGRGDRGHIKIGLFSTLASGFLSRLFRRYDEDHSDVWVDFLEGEAADHARQVRQFEMDMAFVIGKADWPECDAQHLWSERVYVALPDSHSLACISKLNWSELSSERFIVRDTGPGRQIKEYIGTHVFDGDINSHIYIQRVGRANVLNLVALGRGVTLVSESETAIDVPGVTYRPVAGEAVDFSAIWSHRNDNPALRILLSLAKTLATSNTPLSPQR